MKATIQGDFLGAELKSWNMDGRQGVSWAVSILQEDESVKLSAPEPSFNKSEFPERMTPVVCEVDVFRGGGKPKLLAIRAAVRK